MSLILFVTLYSIVMDSVVSSTIFPSRTVPFLSLMLSADRLLMKKINAMIRWLKDLWDIDFGVIISEIKLLDQKWNL